MTYTPFIIKDRRGKDALVGIPGSEDTVVKQLRTTILGETIIIYVRINLTRLYAMLRENPPMLQSIEVEHWFKTEIYHYVNERGQHIAGAPPEHADPQRFTGATVVDWDHVLRTDPRVAGLMLWSPIGDGGALFVDGHHRLARAAQTGMRYYPVFLMGRLDNDFETFWSCCEVFIEARPGQSIHVPSSVETDEDGPCVQRPYTDAASRPKNGRDVPFDSLERIWRRLPRVDCKGLCTDHCTLIAFSTAEADNIIEHGYELPVFDEERQRCSALTEDGRCSIYDARPFICRFWGTTKHLPCEHGCKIRGGITTERLMDIFESLFALSGSRDLVHTAQSEDAIPDEEREMRSHMDALLSMQGKEKGTLIPSAEYQQENES